MTVSDLFAELLKADMDMDILIEAHEPEEGLMTTIRSAQVEMVNVHWEDEEYKKEYFVIKT